ncbi:PTS mannose transporter subunit IIAB [Enterococcus sp. JM4C]|uniref:PTS sugar transporter subunit IIB n=1 Tax=Candidatus Enterococcus huntleyi TaxID=1857217 RepID=UPI00137AC07A|nr:PTS sugar transporter subunit IIB [Enterococcus sp. JM4C]KAF1297116.1 PTS mannose transporter subunit IIAB [Enterococcus sp. JM4C]
MIKLARIDYRLLHGQVVFSWTKTLGINRIIVVNHEAATDEFKKMSLNLAKPTGVKLNIFTVEEALSKMEKVEQLKENIMMIFGNTKETLAFCKVYSKIPEINYGGIPKSGEAKQFGSAIFLNEEEQNEARALKEMGVNQYIQQVPTSKSEDLNKLL